MDGAPAGRHHHLPRRVHAQPDHHRPPVARGPGQGHAGRHQELPEVDVRPVPNPVVSLHQAVLILRSGPVGAGPRREHQHGVPSGSPDGPRLVRGWRGCQQRRGWPPLRVGLAVDLSALHVVRCRKFGVLQLDCGSR